MNMPSDGTMYRALVNRDAGFEGIFIAAVKTTGIFCRPTCTARKPKRENVEFFPTAADALRSGYRPCKVCVPLEPRDAVPEDIRRALDRLSTVPAGKLADRDLRAIGIEPSAVRRWFKKHHGVTFQGYQRLLRVNTAFKKIQAGESVTGAAFDAGYESVSGFADMFKTVLGFTPGDSRQNAVITLSRFESPLGPLIACAVDDGVCLLEFTDRRMIETQLQSLCGRLHATIVQGTHRHIESLQTELDEYFAGRRTAFSVPLCMPGTPFQQDVWRGLLAIPYGETRSYSAQARAIGHPTATRAVARANGMNRIAIVVPCHRVIGEDGALTGYGGGLWRKKWLLDLERSAMERELPSRPAEREPPAR